MSRDGSGNYSLPQAAFTSGTTIESAKVNSNFSDIASALTASLAKDGQTVPTANLPMGTYRHTGVGDATARTHYAAAGQIADNSMGYAADTGSADAYAIAPAPGITAYAVGQRFTFKVVNANATTTPTLAVNGLTAGTIKWPDGTALAVGDLPASSLVEVVVSAVATGTPTFHLQTPAVRWPLAGIRGFIYGLTTSRNSGTPTTKIDVAAGACVDSTNVRVMVTAGGTIDCGTTGANGLDTGSLANTTWYHVFVISKTDGTVALLASTSVDSPTMPSGYTLKRRIGSFRTDGSAQILAYVQDGDFFQWNALGTDITAANPGTSAVTRTLTVPTGVNVMALVILSVANGAGIAASIAYLSDLATSDTTPGASFGDTGPVATATGGIINDQKRVYIRTNTSGQIRSRLSYSDANVTLYISTLGWIDTRGRLG